MPDIMIDITEKGKPRRYEVHRCHYCNTDKYPEGKVIDPTTDKQARQTDKGDYICGYCITERTISLMGVPPEK
jgi:hypothetical protein